MAHDADGNWMDDPKKAVPRFRSPAAHIQIREDAAIQELEESELKVAEREKQERRSHLSVAEDKDNG